MYVCMYVRMQTHVYIEKPIFSRGKVLVEKSQPANCVCVHVCMHMRLHVYARNVCEHAHESAYMRKEICILMLQGFYMTGTRNLCLRYVRMYMCICA
jgi:hypothetical protein